jgi:ferritin-like metal-binding protein YciE
MATSSTSQKSKSSSASGGQTKTLEDLLKDNLKDIYSAEIQLTEALPKMAKAAFSEELQDAFTRHHAETLRHVDRLEKAFNRLGIGKSEVETCMAMKGLIAEGNKLIEEYDQDPARDSALIIAAQKVEHYEIAAYGSICELCDVLGYPQLKNLLGRTLDEEERTDYLLSDIAMDINDEACEMGGYTGEEEEQEEEELKEEY